MKKTISLSLVLMLIVTMMVSCGGNSTTNGTADNSNSGSDSSNASEKVYALVAKDINNPYMKKEFEGFEAACNELGVTSIYKGPQEPTPEMQIESINQLIAQKVDLIAVSANDYDALEPVLKDAMSKGIEVISLDSAVNPNSRVTHINQADPEKIGRTLIQAAYEMVDGNGGIAILSATSQASNQNLWIEWMQKELDENPDKYKNTPLVKIAYGDDDPTKSTSETQALLTDESIKVIIAPTTVGMLAAGKYLQDNKSDVKLTGLGLPSEMAPFIEDGTCPWMYLWNPIDLGYLSAYTGNEIVSGNISGSVNDTFTVPNMGDMAVTEAPDGGTEVLLGDPFKFDAENISTWKEIY